MGEFYGIGTITAYYYYSYCTRPGCEWQSEDMTSEGEARIQWEFHNDEMHVQEAERDG